MAHRFISYLLKNQFIFALFLILLGWFVIQIKGIITLVFISYIIMSALLPAVSYFERRKFPKMLSVVIPFVSILLISFLIIYPLVSFTLSQVQSLLVNLPMFINESAKTLGVEVDSNEIQTLVTNEVQNISKNAFAVTSAVFGGVFSLLTVIIVSFYMLLYHGSLKHGIASLFHKDKHELIYKTLSQIDSKLGSWLRGQLVLCVAIGVVTYIALNILGLGQFALPLAVLAGILEVVPTLGPILSSIPAIIIALTISPTLALFVALSYIIIQMLENNFLVPKIMQKAVGLNPIIVIVGVMTGANLMGVFGALLSIPFISFMIVLFSGIKEIIEAK